MPFSVPIAGMIDVTDPRDKYPTHNSNLGFGGIHHVATVIERDAIPVDRRVAGMLCTVLSDNRIYQLSFDLTEWVLLDIGNIDAGKIRVDFSFNDVSKPLFRVYQNDVVNITVFITQAFPNDIGIEIVPYMSANYIDSSIIESYDYKFIASEERDLELSISGSPAYGQGFLIINK
jgi:hypothetical protein